MIHGFARQSNGQVRIHSTMGQETSVSLYLPRQRSPQAPDALLQTVAQSSDAMSGTMVLIVDDEETVRRLIAEVLQESGSFDH